MGNSILYHSGFFTHVNTSPSHPPSEQDDWSHRNQPHLIILAWFAKKCPVSTCLNSPFHQCYHIVLVTCFRSIPLEGKMTPLSWIHRLLVKYKGQQQANWTEWPLTSGYNTAKSTWPEHWMMHGYLCIYMYRVKPRGFNLDIYSVW